MTRTVVVPVALLERLEWSGATLGYTQYGASLEPACPACGGMPAPNADVCGGTVGHADDCELAAALALAKRNEEESK